MGLRCVSLCSLCLCLFVPGCDGPSSVDESDTRQGTIYNGQPDSGHPSVGMLLIDNNKHLCTATLIGKRTMLTAAHCLYKLSDPGKYEVRLGGTSYKVASRTVHPGWQDTNVIAQAAPNDIGILRLQQAPNVAPSPISTSAPHTGQMITLVGYGVTDFDKKDAKVKRVAVASVDAVYPGYIKYGGYNGAPEGAHRAGDSGGPSFASTGGQEAVIAVHSIGNKPTGLVFDCRVDRHVAWIKQQAGGDVVVAGAGSQPSNPGAPGLSGLLGQPCQNHGECKALVCGSLGGQARCTIPCTTGAFCRVGSKCYATQIPNVGMCWPPTGGQAPNTTPPTGAPQKTPYGQPCAQNGDCQSSLCADVNGKKFCTMACGSGSWVVCPLTSICLPTQIPGLSACVPTL